MMGNLGNMQKMMKQVQKMQEDMAKAQEELAARSVEASSGGGAVSVEVTGSHELRKITIDASVIDPEDKEMLEDLILAAVNEGMRKAQQMVTDEMGKLANGLKLPPGLI